MCSNALFSAAKAINMSALFLMCNSPDDRSSVKLRVVKKNLLKNLNKTYYMMYHANIFPHQIHVEQLLNQFFSLLTYQLSSHTYVHFVSNHVALVHCCQVRYNICKLYELKTFKPATNSYQNTFFFHLLSEWLIMNF